MKKRFFMVILRFFSIIGKHVQFTEIENKVTKVNCHNSLTFV